MRTPLIIGLAPTLALALGLFALVVPALAANPPTLAALALPAGKPKELGAVRWLRGYDSAATRAREARRPLLVLFNEVPGCHTCVSFGKEVLTDALLVEAAESLFTPLAVYNNIGGEDAMTLDRFREPAWNNPVVRVIDPANNKDLTTRVGDNYGIGTVAAAMATGLKAGGTEPPGYLKLLAQTPAPESKTERAVFAMFCFWEGEAKLGGLTGVVSTSSGFMDGKECVEVEFDPARLSFRDLIKAAKQMDCLHATYTTTIDQQAVASSLVGSRAHRATGTMRVSESDTKYHLSRSAYREVPMTPMQACRVNAELGAGREPETWLSPKQLRSKRGE
ncbi:MAG: VPGUxxT family thioredoxin-like (seleno)protein, type 2 [Phycisphaerales bacterium]